MDFKQLFDDDRAVSPVIGVILMVAITVILAAVIGTFVLGLGDQVQNTTPQASFGFDTADGKVNVEITHETGDTIAASDLSLVTTASFNASASAGTGFSDTTSETWSTISDSSDDVAAGSTVTIARHDATSGDGQNTWAGETIRVVYDSPDSDSSSTLGKFEVPE